MRSAIGQRHVVLEGKNKKGQNDATAEKVQQVRLRLYRLRDENAATKNAASIRVQSEKERKTDRQTDRRTDRLNCLLNQCTKI